MSVRLPAVSGSFYPGDPAELKSFCENQLPPNHGTSARAVILPHAGYIYSGETACKTLNQVQVPSKVLLIGPNHRGVGSDFAVDENEIWESPLGRVRLARELTDELLQVPDIGKDKTSHETEHSLEVLVPFLQTKNPAAEIIPLTVGTLNLEKAREVAEGVGEVLAPHAAELLVVISNDMSHYESDQVTRAKDAYALQAIESLDPEALVQAVWQHGITMCGYLPVFMLLVMKEKLGIKKARLVDYRTSGEVSGDLSRVVGYAGFIFE